MQFFTYFNFSHFQYDIIFLLFYTLSLHSSFDHIFNRSLFIYITLIRSNSSIFNIKIFNIDSDIKARKYYIQLYNCLRKCVIVNTLKKFMFL